MKYRKNQFNYLFYMLTIFVASSVLFLIGFFPTSLNLIGNDGKHYYSIKSNKLDNFTLQKPSPKYDQLVFMIIDALRYDYFNATNMPYVYENICDYIQIKVDIPTVTMPRIKSLTTGTISNFIDIVLNLGRASKLDDSILHRMKEKNKTSIFAGDRTWLQLFPNKFIRTFPNTDSFFVNDFFEGDMNVTKVLRKELNLSDWHLMVLHYLGLDHIGHVEGSHSDKIFKKLIEMDNVIKYISSNARLKKKLLLITGDHGMRNGGSHGGCSEEELYVPLMVFHDNCVKQKWSNVIYDQIDITATLAVLLDVQIPRTSIGSLIPEILESYSKEEQLYYYYYNTLHLMEIWKLRSNTDDVQFKDYISWFTDAKISHKEFISSHAKSSVSYEKAKQNYMRLSKKISKLLSDSLVRYDMTLITITLSLTTLTSLNIIIKIVFKNASNLSEGNQFIWKKFLTCFCFAGCIIVLVHFQNLLDTKSFINPFLVTFAVALSLYFGLDVFHLILNLIVIPLIRNRKIAIKLSIPFVILSMFLCHTFSLASSSLIEEEHQTWYYFTPSLLIYLTTQNFYINVRSVLQNHRKLINILLNEFWNMRFALVVLITIIGCRRLNQTGDKWRHLVDIGDILSRNGNHVYLSLTLITGLLLLLLMLKKYNSTLEMSFCFLALGAVFMFRETKKYSITFLLLFWASVFILGIKKYHAVFYKNKNYEYYGKGNLIELLKTNLTCCLLISALLHKPHNVILLAALINTLEKSFHLCNNLKIQNKFYNRSYVLVLKTVITIFIANMFYFFQGNSNSLTTIDLNPGYIGLSSYNPFIVGLLITLNTYCAHINAFLYLIWHMFSTQRDTLPLRQEKEQIPNVQMVESTEEDFHLIYNLFTATTIMPIGVYWCILVGFRYHLFIYSVFAPKAIYECLHLLVFYINFIVTNLYFRLFIK